MIPHIVHSDASTRKYSLRPARPRGPAAKPKTARTRASAPRIPMQPYSNGALLQYFHPEIFNDGVGEHVAGDLADFPLCFLPGCFRCNLDIKELSLPDRGNQLMPVPFEGRADGLALRVKNSGLQRHVDSKLHFLIM